MDQDLQKLGTAAGHPLTIANRHDIGFPTSDHWLYVPDSISKSIFRQQEAGKKMWGRMWYEIGPTEFFQIVSYTY
jgi:hypothetical protein